jgi:hypothetical protein
VQYFIAQTKQYFIAQQVPLKLASAGSGSAEELPVGIDYVISFAVGAAIVNILIW